MLKIIHVSAVSLTLISFFVRGLWMLGDSPWLQARPVKIAPHIIDTILLASAIGLMFQIHQYPGTAPWLTAKVSALLVYILLGELAFRGKSRGLRVGGWIGGLAVFAYIVLVALSHNPLPFMGTE